MLWLGEPRCCYFFSTTWGQNSSKYVSGHMFYEWLLPSASRCVASLVSFCLLPGDRESPYLCLKRLASCMIDTSRPSRPPLC